MKQTKDDQLVIPISLLDGLALRAVAEHDDISLASLVRRLIMEGLPKTHYGEVYNKKRAELAQLPHIELLKLKSNITK